MSLMATIFLSFSLLLSDAAASDPTTALYADPDPAAVYLVVPPGRRAAYRQKISAAIQKDPHNSVALSHRAYLFADGDDPVRAKRDFDAALKYAGQDLVYQRNVLWARGWVNYDLGSVDVALADWGRAEQLHGGHPYWVSYTYALGHWTMGSREIALRWFDATVRAIPAWGTDAGFEQKIRHWRPHQQEQIRALFAKWRSRHPITAG